MSLTNDNRGRKEDSKLLFLCNALMLSTQGVLFQNNLKNDVNELY